MRATAKEHAGKPAGRSRGRRVRRPSGYGEVARSPAQRRRGFFGGTGLVGVFPAAKSKSHCRVGLERAGPISQCGRGATLPRPARRPRASLAGDWESLIARFQVGGATCTDRTVLVGEACYYQTRPLRARDRAGADLRLRRQRSVAGAARTRSHLELPAPGERKLGNRRPAPRGGRLLSAARPAAMRWAFA